MPEQPKPRKRRVIVEITFIGDMDVLEWMQGLQGLFGMSPEELLILLEDVDDNEL